MKTIIKKLLHDFWLSKGKFFMCILAAALSAWGVSGVIYSYFLSERDFQLNFSATQPADLILSINHSSDKLLDQLRQEPEILALERREVLSGRIKTGSDNWMPFLLFAAENFNQLKLNKFRILDNDLNLDKKLLIEKNGDVFLKKEASELEILFPGREPIKIPKGGYVHDARMPPSRMEQMVYGYTEIQQIPELLTGRDDHRYLVKVKAKKTDQVSLKRMAQKWENTIEDHGGILSAVSIPPPGEHPHQNIVDGISFLQRSFGYILSLLGIALLSLVLLTWLAPQIPQIGIMKAIGAPTQQILNGYLAVLSLIMALGLLIGIPLGYFTATVYSNFIAFVQNFDPVSGLLPLPIHILALGMTLLVPMAFSIFPLIQITKTNVRNALSKTFHIPNKAFFKYTQSLISNSQRKYEINNLFRKSLNTFLIMAILSVGLALFIAGSNLEYALKKDLDHFFENTDYTLTVNISDPEKTRKPALESIPSIQKISYAQRKAVGFQPPNKSHIENTSMTIFPEDFILSKRLVLVGEINKSCDNCVFINQAFSQDFADLQIGDLIELVESNGEKINRTFAGVIKEVAVAPGFYQFSNKVFSSYNQMNIQLRAGASAEEVIPQIENALDEQGFQISHVLDVSRRMAMLDNHLKPSFLTIQVMGIGTILVGIIGLLIVLSLTIQERTREIGMLKAIGGSTQKIANLFWNEYLFINLIAIGLGLLFSIGLTYYLCYLFGVMVIKTGIPPNFNPGLMLGSIFLILALQYLIIQTYTRNKIRNSAQLLLNQVF